MMIMETAWLVYYVGVPTGAHHVAAGAHANALDMERQRDQQQGGSRDTCVYEGWGGEREAAAGRDTAGRGILQFPLLRVCLRLCCLCLPHWQNVIAVECRVLVRVCPLCSRVGLHVVRFT